MAWVPIYKDAKSGKILATIFSWPLTPALCPCIIHFMNSEITLGKILRKKKLKIAIAESCTGGLISDRITNISGSSSYFICGIVAYSNEIKEKMLKVPHDLIKKHGAVSKEVAIAMAEGVRVLADTDMGIGITGIAGPTGDTKLKPVGLVYTALVADRKKVVKKFLFKGSRVKIKSQAAQTALDLICKTLNSKH